MGWFKKFRRAVKKTYKKVDNFVEKKVERPVKKVVKAVDKAVVEPLEKPVKKVVKAVDKAVVEPLERPIKKVVKKIATEVEDTVTGKDKYTRRGDTGGARTAASKAAPRQKTEEPEAFVEEGSLKIKKKRRGKRQLRVEPQAGLKIEGQGGLNVPKG